MRIIVQPTNGLAPAVAEVHILIGSRRPVVKDNRFHFQLSWFTPQGRTAKQRLTETNGLICQSDANPTTGTITIAGYSCKIVSERNLIELRADLLDAITGETLASDTQFLDLGFESRNPSIHTDLSTPVVAGEERNLLLTFQDGSGRSLAPTTTIQLQLSSDTGCAEFGYVSDPTTKIGRYLPRNSINIPAGNIQPSGQLLLRATKWSSSNCTLTYTPSIIGGWDLPVQHFPFSVHPDFIRSLLLTLSGAFLYWFLGGLVSVSTSVGTASPVSVTQAFVGPHCCPN
jgi:hypothetical protein